MESTQQPKVTTEEEELLDLQPAGALDADEEKNLAEFLKKVS
jgi:hypothetical protein